MKKIFLPIALATMALVSCGIPPTSSLSSSQSIGSSGSSSSSSSSSQGQTIYGKGAPSDNLGENGDIYIDLLTNDTYEKNWLVGWRKISEGSSSLSSSEILSSASSILSSSSSEAISSSHTPILYTDHGTPSASLGEVGDKYLDLSTGYLYEKTSRGWARTGNIEVSSSSSKEVVSSSSETVVSSSSEESVISSEIVSSSEEAVISSESSASSEVVSSSSISSNVESSVSSEGTSSFSSIESSLSSQSSDSSVVSSSSSPSSSISSEESDPGYYKASIEDGGINFFSMGAFNEDPTVNTIGTQKLLVLPIEFSSMPFTESRLNDIKIACGGTSEETNYWESLKSYYAKSSFGKLDFEFEYADPYTVAASPKAWYDKYKSSYETSAMPEIAMQKAVEAYKNKGGDTKQFDSDGDGYIDACIMVYSVPDLQADSSLEAYGDLFWAYQYVDTTFPDGDKDSPVGSRYFWASYDFFYEGVEEGKGVDAHTLIHEMGHILGADDYYNYAYDSAEVSEPSGCSIMMAYNIGDHDAFTKLSYRWVDPYVVTGDCTITIKPSESSGDCIVLADHWNGTAFDEYVVFELYTPTGLNKLDAETTYNTVTMPTTFGIRAYHIDARLFSANWDEYEEDYTNAKYLTDDEVANFPSLAEDLYNDEKYVVVAATNTKAYDATFIQNKGYELIQLIQAGKTNSTQKGNEMSDDDLFQTGDTFTLSSYKNFFNGTKLNNGNALPYSVSFDSVTASSATLTFTKTA